MYRDPPKKEYVDTLQFLKVRSQPAYCATSFARAKDTSQGTHKGDLIFVPPT